MTKILPILLAWALAHPAAPPAAHPIAGLEALPATSWQAGISRPFVVAASPPQQAAPSSSIVLPAPTRLRFEGGSIGTTATGSYRLFPRLLWDAVSGARTYEVKIAWSSGTVIYLWAPTEGPEFPVPMGMPDHRYQVSVRACGAPPASAPSLLATDSQCWFAAPASPAASMVMER